MYSINDFPSNSHVWVYQSNRLLTNDEVAKIKELAEVFVDQWESHGSPVKGMIEVRDNAFIIVVADDQGNTMCGRAKDSSVRLIKEFEEVLGIPFLDRMNTVWKENNQLVFGHMNVFRSKASKGEVTTNTIVYNNTITTKEDLDNNWEVAAKESWHNQLL